MALRPLSAVPRPVLGLLALTLALQLGWQASRPAGPALATPLPPAPPLALLQLASLGEPVALARVLTLTLQASDDQAGVSVGWRHLDYNALAQWLERALQLDPRGQAPLLAASEVYGAVDDPARVRLMLDLVYRAFDADPDRRWPWLAHASLVARHRLHDLPLARRYAAAIRQRALGPGVPAWARELEGFVLEDMNEIDSARVLVGGLLRDGRITDPHELRFLAERLDALAARQRAPSTALSPVQSPPQSPAPANPSRTPRK